MNEKIYWILNFICQKCVVYPYWGVLRNVRTKEYFKTKESYTLSGKWLYIVFDISDKGRIDDFKALHYTPDFSVTDIYNRHIFICYRLDIPSKKEGIEDDLF